MSESSIGLCLRLKKEVLMMMKRKKKRRKKIKDKLH
jgi:hypothetical protein